MFPVPPLTFWPFRPIGISILGIVFHRSVHDVKNHFLPGEPTSASYSGFVNRDADELAWVNGTSKWIMCTSTMLYGVDNRRCNVVIFVSYHKGLVDTTQGIGRGGRAGQETLVFFITTSNDSKILHDEHLPDPGCIREGETLYYGPRQRCRRMPFGGVFNGKELSCQEIQGAVLCDICDNNYPLVEKIKAIVPNPLVQPAARSAAPRPAAASAASGSNIVTVPAPGSVRPSMPVQMDAAHFAANTQSMRDKNHRLSDLCQRLVNNCAACYAFTGDLLPSGNTHCTFTDCAKGSHYTEAEWGNPYMAYQAEVTFPPYAACYGCGFPQNNNKDTLNAQPACHATPGPGVRCPVRDACKHIAWVLRYTPYFWNEIVKVFPKLEQEISNKEYARWLCKGGVLNERHYNGAELMVWLDTVYNP
ncbi:hypothetical protein C8J57DRAFT_1537868 [Mycena rebaudengoi]|nr:hypothetical protein C8J57DRAFT_1537868 [Mycena rebaudengoi]